VKDTSNTAPAPEPCSLTDAQIRDARNELTLVAIREVLSFHDVDPRCPGECALDLIRDAMSEFVAGYEAEGVSE
jgi:hypothetical protein